MTLPTPLFSTPKHAHLDCFSGAAGDMLLAALIDATPNPGKTLSIIQSCLEGIPELKGEFKLRTMQVLRGSGSIGARKVDVESIYDHQSAPVPASTDNHDHSHSHKDEEIISQNHSHEHSHTHTHDHSNEHKHEHGHSHSHNDANGPLRNLPQIKKLLELSTTLPETTKKLAIESFTALAHAEAKTHNSTFSQVHFHEVGAVDSIVDTVGVLLALFLCNVTSISCSRLPMGEGMVNTSHGIMPIPAPATLRLFQELKVTSGPPGWEDGTTGELVTPTAAALINVLTNKGENMGRCPNMKIERVGIGAGTKNFRLHPNIVRVILGEKENDNSSKPKKTKSENATSMKEHSHNHDHAHEHEHSHDHSQDYSQNLSHYHSHAHSHEQKQSDEQKELNSDKQLYDNKISLEIKSESDTAEINSNEGLNFFPTGRLIDWKTHKLLQLEANIDDTTPEILAYTAEKLLKTSIAIDVWIQPIMMKKGRCAHTLFCLCHDKGNDENDHVSKLMKIIFQETTTLGIRIHRNIERTALHRTFIKIEIDKDLYVNVKIGYLLKTNKNAEIEEKEVMTVSPEFEDCKNVAIALDMPLKDVMEKAKMLARNVLIPNDGWLL